MYIVIFNFKNGDTPNYVGPFKDYKDAEYFRTQWVHRFTEDKGSISLVRIETPKTPDQCRLPQYAK